jgi:hypothetical protein
MKGRLVANVRYSGLKGRSMTSISVISRTVRRVPLTLGVRPGQSWEPSRLPLRLRPAECLECPVDHPGKSSDYAWVHALMETLHVVSITDAYRYMPAAITSIPHTPNAAPGQELRDLIGATIGESKLDYAELAVAALIERAGLDPATWGTCQHCKGTGYIDAYPGQVSDRLAYTYPEPPTGDAWQLWTDGTPIRALTDAYTEPEHLIDHLVDHGEHPNYLTYTLTAASALIEHGHMGNGIVHNGRCVIYSA